MSYMPYCMCEGVYDNYVRINGSNALCGWYLYSNILSLSVAIVTSSNYELQPWLVIWDNNT